MFYEGGGVSGAKLIKKAKNKKLRSYSLKTQIPNPTQIYNYVLPDIKMPFLPIHK